MLCDLKQRIYIWQFYRPDAAHNEHDQEINIAAIHSCMWQTATLAYVF